MIGNIIQNTLKHDPDNYYSISQDKDIAHNIIWKENIDNSFYVEESLNKKDTRILIPLKNAPEKILTNLYLLKIPKVKIEKVYLYVVHVLENITPIELLKAIYTKKKLDDNGLPPLPSNFPAYIYGFRYGEKTVRRKNFRGTISDKNYWIPNEYDNSINGKFLSLRPDRPTDRRRN